MRWRVVPTRANGQLGLRLLPVDDEARAFAAHGIIVLTLDGARIAELIAFLEPEAFARFGLPDAMTPSLTSGDQAAHTAT